MDVETATVLVAGISVVIAAINSIVSSRKAEEQRQLTLEAQQQALETRQAQLFMQIYDRWTSKDMTSAYGLLRYKYTWENPEEAFEKFIYNFNVEVYSNFQIMHNFYEGLGVLVRKGLIDITLVEDLFSQRIIWHWEHHKTLFLLARERTNDPTQYESIEYLYNQMMQRLQKTST